MLQEERHRPLPYLKPHPYHQVCQMVAKSVDLTPANTDIS